MEFGDRVKNWITINEPQAYASNGYASGTYAPGRGKKNGAGNPGTEPYIVGHNLLLSHAAIVDLYRQRFQVLDVSVSYISATLSNKCLYIHKSSFRETI